MVDAPAATVVLIFSWCRLVDICTPVNISSGSRVKSMFFHFIAELEYIKILVIFIAELEGSQISDIPGLLI